MTVRKTITQPTREVKRFIVPEIDAGIRKLRRRVEEVIGLALGFHYSDAKAKTAEHNIRETIREVFGQNSPEFDDHQYHGIGDDGYTMGATDYEMQLNFLAGIPQTAGMLEGLIARLEEKRADLSESPSVSPTGTSRPVVSALS